MQTSPAITVGAVAPSHAAPRQALVSWVMVDWAVQPFHTLIITFLFAPYFANTVIPATEANKAGGQAYWGYALAAAGVLIAVGSPLLGALADGRGRRKPWVALFALVLVAAMATLWIAVPAAPGATVFLVLLAVVLAMAAAEFTAVFTNAMMPGLVPREQLGRLSGTGWAVGYAGGLASLLLLIGFIVPSAGSTQTLFSFDPILSLDSASGEANRFVGPFSALWYAVFIIPFFLFVPDVRVPRAAGGRSVLAELGETLRALPGHRDMLYFLVARMLYSDGLAAIFAFGGIYGKSVFGWGLDELAVFGIIIILTGIFGALMGGFLDDRIGSKRVIMGALLVLLAGAIGILSIDQTHILFTTEVEAKQPGSASFSSTGEKVFLLFAMIIGLVSAPAQAASRSLLARLAPPEKVTQYFGLFAFSGKATAFLAPFLVSSVTLATDSQRLGMATIALFLVIGMVLMIPVRAPR